MVDDARGTSLRRTCAPRRKTARARSPADGRCARANSRRPDHPGVAIGRRRVAACTVRNSRRFRRQAGQQKAPRVGFEMAARGKSERLAPALTRGARISSGYNVVGVKQPKMPRQVWLAPITEARVSALDRIAVSPRAYRPVKATCRLAASSIPPNANGRGEYLLWLSEAEVDRDLPTRPAERRPRRALAKTHSSQPKRARDCARNIPAGAARFRGLGSGEIRE